MSVSVVNAVPGSNSTSGSLIRGGWESIARLGESESGNPVDSDATQTVATIQDRGYEDPRAGFPISGTPSPLCHP